MAWRPIFDQFWNYFGFSALQHEPGNTIMAVNVALKKAELSIHLTTQVRVHPKWALYVQASAAEEVQARELLWSGQAATILGTKKQPKDQNRLQ